MGMAVTSIRSPSGALCAGKYGAELLVLGGISDEALEYQIHNWKICEETAAENNRQVTRRQWRITVMTHPAETRQQAVKDLGFGLQNWVDYSHHVLSASPFPDDVDDPVPWGMDHKLLLVWTPDQAIHEIEQAQTVTGGFGTFLCFANNF